MTIQIDPKTGERIRQVTTPNKTQGIQIDPKTGERIRPQPTAQPTYNQQTNEFSGTPQIKNVNAPATPGEIVTGFAQGTGVPAVLKTIQSAASNIPGVNQFIKNPYIGKGASEIVSETAPAAIPILGPGAMLIGGISGAALAASGLDEKISEGVQKINKLVENNAPAAAILGTIEDISPIVLSIMGGRKPSKVGKFKSIVSKEVAEAGPQALTQDIFDKVKIINKQAGEKIGSVEKYIIENPASITIKEGQFLPNDLANKITDIYGRMKPSLSDNARSTFEQFIREAQYIDKNLNPALQWKAVNDLRQRFGASELEKANPTKGTNKIYKAFMEVLEDSVPENQKGILKQANKDFHDTIRLTEEFKANAFGDVKEGIDLTSQPGLTEALKTYTPWEVKNKMLGQIYDNAFNAAGEFDSVKLGKYLNKINRNKLTQEVLGSDFTEIQKLSNANPGRFQTFMSQVMNNRLFGIAKPATMLKQAAGELIMPGQELRPFIPAVIGGQAEIQSSPQGRRVLLERRKNYLNALEQRKRKVKN
jgi:hypothetical protein